ncbi:unnamed protein product [Thelazia callipaeda]|uniref:Protein CASP n=1 Tax=Thelazia callipaeda TaxID=103827 RepID=A0A0N5D146_THECL|nr:unnamed protein product [Thelazia callipaeda]
MPCADIAIWFCVVFYAFYDKHLTAVDGTRRQLEKVVEEQRLLIARLEDDLLNLQAIIPQSVGDGANTERDSGEYEFSAAKMLAKELSLSDGQRKNIENCDSNILSILSSQRERLRHRVDELERDLVVQKQTNKYLESEREKIREDNVKLFEKIKFLQIYGSKVGQAVVKIESDETEARYENDYEKHLDPFKKFNMQEKRRKYGQLRVYDKAAFTLGQWLMNSGHSRIFFFIYLMFLHIMVIVVLYRFALAGSCLRDFQTDCIGKSVIVIYSYI